MNLKPLLLLMNMVCSVKFSDFAHPNLTSYVTICIKIMYSASLKHFLAYWQKDFSILEKEYDWPSDSMTHSLYYYIYIISVKWCNFDTWCYIVFFFLILWAMIFTLNYLNSDSHFWIYHTNFLDLRWCLPSPSLSPSWLYRRRYLPLHLPWQKYFPFIHIFR